MQVGHYGERGEVSQGGSQCKFEVVMVVVVVGGTEMTGGGGVTRVAPPWR